MDKFDQSITNARQAMNDIFEFNTDLYQKLIDASGFRVKVADWTWVMHKDNYTGKSIILEGRVGTKFVITRTNEGSFEVQKYNDEKAIWNPRDGAKFFSLEDIVDFMTIMGDLREISF